MRLDPETARKTHVCKLKAVNPPFRSVSTPRARKELRVVGRVNPTPGARRRRPRFDLSEWNARRLARKLQEQLSREAWERLFVLAKRRGSSVEELLEDGLWEAG